LAAGVTLSTEIASLLGASCGDGADWLAANGGRSATAVGARCVSRRTDATACSASSVAVSSSGSDVLFVTTWQGGAAGLAAATSLDAMIGAVEAGCGPVCCAARIAEAKNCGNSALMTVSTVG